MILDVALHFGLDMAGACTFACLLGKCKTEGHSHGRLLSVLAKNPWVVQSASALILAIITVRLVG